MVLKKKFYSDLHRMFSAAAGDVVGDLKPLVKKILLRRREFLRLANRYPAPMYILDELELQNSIDQFTSAFCHYLPGVEIYYAMKVNHHPRIVKTAVERGLGVDVSSGRELMLAKKAGVKKMVFSGPGKTVEELQLALKHHNQIIVNFDSFRELEKLGKLARQQKKVIRAGARVFTRYHGSWNKFGIPLDDLRAFWLAARKFKNIKLSGIQFHASFNRDIRPYELILSEIGSYLRAHFSADMLQTLEFIDIGGGFLPDQSEGYYPWATARGKIVKLVDEFYGRESNFPEKYFIARAYTPEQYARGIAAAIKKHIAHVVNCRYLVEPGRIICNNAMHILLRVLDKKSADRAVLNGGINLIGWERFEDDYFPVINLTHPSSRELPCKLYGDLCMTEDVWGNYCYAKKIEEGDFLLVPCQGAMTYSLSQNFIKPLPAVRVLPDK